MSSESNLLDFLLGRPINYLGLAELDGWESLWDVN